MIEHILIFILLFAIFIAGILFHKYILCTVDNGYSTQIAAKKDKKRVYSNIQIDDKKIVADIGTDGLEQKHTSLGKTTETDDNTQQAISKLKNIKRG